MLAIGLFVVLLLAKVLVIVTGAGVDWSALIYLWQDAALVLVFALLERVCDVWVRRPRLAWWVYFGVVIYTALNIAVVQVLSTPLTWSMVHATDAALADSITHHVGWKTLGLPLVLCAVAVVPWWLRSTAPRPGFARPLWLAAAVLVVAGPFLTGRVTAARSCNAVVTLLASYLPRIEAVAMEPRDWRGSVESKEAWGGLTGAAERRNVVLVILESVGAQYLAPYGAAEDPMPNLTRLAARSVLFENTYAVYPESIKGLVALQSSLHPAMDTEPRQYRELPVPALGTVLGAAGYRTGLFHSGRFEYLGMADVIANAGYEVAVDAGGISGNHESSFGVDEAATVERMLAWVDGPRSGPFFLTYMPVAGHHPYDSPAAGPFDAREVIGCYRNAIHSADGSLGRLIDGLRSRRLWEDTVFVVVGDHGQAFGQHPGNFGHTFFLYEENVHVPFLIAAPGLVTEPIRVESVTSHVDVAPTILGLLGILPPPGYEGFDMLRHRRALALMFTDYAQAFVGLRDGRFKFIHHVEAGASQLFDLDSDPGERRDLSAQHPRRVGGYRQRLLEWAASRRGSVAERRTRR